MTNKESIILWNIKRFSTNFSPELEESMLKEEVSEFFTAYQNYLKTGKKDKNLLADMIDAYCDLYFVYQGTIFKAGLNNTNENIEKINTLLEYGEKWLKVEMVILKRILKSKTFKIIHKAITYVVEANEAKPISKDNKGKVIKGEDWKDPKEEIKKLLKDIK